MTFDEFGLAAPLVQAIADEKHLEPTPIQTQAIPPALTGRDLVGIAQTGTGKTAAFALPILHRLANAGKPSGLGTPRVLVLSPTRELASQIAERFGAYGRHLRPSVALIIGGVAMGPQKRLLAGQVDVVVATPGRLLDHLQTRAVRLDRIETLVLDEADRMLDMGFIRDIRKIVAALPTERQTMLFSATMPREIASLADSMMDNPVRVAATPVSSATPQVEQTIVHVDRTAKPGRLVQLLTEAPTERTLIFTRTKHGADRIVRTLAKASIKAVAIHGNKSQNQRENALAAFRSARSTILVATDIAARGIDVPGINHVVNYDLPNIAETYVHRIGRTGRAGAVGRATSFCTQDEQASLRSIEKLVGTAIQIIGDGTPTTPRADPQRPGKNRQSAKPRNKGRRRRNQRGQTSHRPDGIDPVPFLLRPRARPGDRAGSRS